MTLVRKHLPNGSVRYEKAPGDSEPALGFVDAGRSHLEPTLRSHDFQYVGTERRGNVTYHVLTGETGHVERDERPDARNYRLTVRVTDEGLVESMTLRFDTVRNGVNVTVVQRFRTFDVGSTTVERPDWYDEAVNATD